MSIRIQQFQDALVQIAGEFDRTCSKGSAQRAGIGDLVDGATISKSRCVHLRQFKQEYLAQAFRTLLNEMSPSRGRLVSCLPIIPEWASRSANFRDDKTGVMFEIYEYEQYGEKIMSVATAWGSDQAT